MGGVCDSFPNGFEMVVAFIGITIEMVFAFQRSCPRSTVPNEFAQRQAEEGNRDSSTLSVGANNTSQGFDSAACFLVHRLGSLKPCLPERESMNGSSRSGVRRRLTDASSPSPSPLRGKNKSGVYSSTRTCFHWVMGDLHDRQGLWRRRG